MSESKFIKHVRCEECGSSDANALYDDNHTHCFSCGATTSAEGVKTTETPKPVNKDLSYYDTANTVSI